MKFGIIIQDLDAAQAANILENLSGESVQATIVKSAEAIVTGNESEFDTDGTPWDERIHAGTKSKNADGRWKRRKGVSDEDVAKVQSELKGGAPVAAPVAPVAHVIPVAAAPSPMAEKLDRLEQQVGIQPPVAAPVAPPVPAPVAAPVAPAPIARDFKGIMQRLSDLFGAKVIDTAYPNTIVTRVNNAYGVKLATMTDIANDPRFVEYAWACLDVDGNGLNKAA